MRPLPRIAVSYWTQARFDKRARPGGVAFSLRVMLNSAIRQGHIERNPVRGGKFLAEGSGCMRVVSREEQKSYGNCWGTWWGKITPPATVVKKRPGQLTTF